jgi:hypothetical protein
MVWRSCAICARVLLPEWPLEVVLRGGVVVQTAEGLGKHGEDICIRINELKYLHYDSQENVNGGAQCDC